MSKDATVLAKELEEERQRNASLTNKLKKAKASNRLLEKSMGEGSFVRLHSTMREDDSANVQSSVLMSSMSNLSFASLQVPECKPINDEEEIDRKTYEQWKQMLEASMQLAGVNDEITKMNIFKIKAGPKLLDVLDGTTSSAESPDAATCPYSNAIQRLDAFFGSRDYTFMQRQKLRSLIQQPGEQDVKYVKRVIAIAKLCDYDDANLAEHVADTIQCHAVNRSIREIGRKILRKRGSLADLLDKVRAAEMEQLNEEIFAKSHASAQLEVAAVSYGQGRTPSSNYSAGSSTNQRPRYFGTFRGRRGLGRSRGFNRREFIRNETSRIECWRCKSVRHQPSECNAIDKVCFKCQRKGHIGRACQQMMQSTKRRNSNDGIDTTHPKKIAFVKNDEDGPVEESVSAHTTE